MSERTPLERDIEHHERARIPFMVYVMVILLFISVGFLGAYTVDLKKNIEKKDREIALMKEQFLKEKVALLGKIKELEKEALR